METISIHKPKVVVIGSCNRHGCESQLTACTSETILEALLYEFRRQGATKLLQHPAWEPKYFHLKIGYDLFDYKH